MRLLDPRFNYVPAVATDVRDTWRRFGFDARKNEERRWRLKQLPAEAVGDGEAPPIRALVLRKA